MKWTGVITAMTTRFLEDGQIDHAFVAQHSRWMVDNGCTGIVAPGSLAEAATLSFEERKALLQTCVRALKGHGSVVGAVSSLSTAESVAFAKAAAEIGCDGLMVLPPYVYVGDWPEMRAHVGAIFQATPLSCMLYNNPISYGTDFLPEHIEELAGKYRNFQSVKESRGDARRVSAIRALIGDRLDVFIGVDDVILEGVAAGAVGWIAGLANAFPRESVDLFEYCRAGKSKEAFELYRWFLPLLRLDTVPKFVQLIKLVQQELGVGSARVRAPRMEITGSELEATLRLVRHAVKTRPQHASSAFTQSKQAGS
jgi:dihydrodipicolinate synthase/N-acetylneuraminate lyase